MEMPENMDELIRQCKNAYHREWCRKNKDKVKKINNRFYAKRAKKLLENKEV